MAIDLSGADAYFQTHVNGTAWEDFDAHLRIRGIAHAKRMISERVADFLDADTVDGDMPRHDVAVYEQALFLLSGSALPRDGESGAPRYLDADIEGPGNAIAEGKLCKAALHYITGPRPFPPVALSRG